MLRLSLILEGLGGTEEHNYSTLRRMTTLTTSFTQDRATLLRSVFNSKKSLLYSYLTKVSTSIYLCRVSYIGAWKMQKHLILLLSQLNALSRIPYNLFLRFYQHQISAPVLAQLTLGAVAHNFSCIPQSHQRLSSDRPL